MVFLVRLRLPLVGGTAQYFSIFGETPISKSLEISPTIFDKRLLVKSLFDRVSNRNVRNGKTPVIGISSTLLELQLVHAPLTPYRSASEIPASACSLGGPERALGGNFTLLTYGLPYC